MFFVYPGPQGPVDNIRWEMLRQGLQDYECLWMARRGIEDLRSSGTRPDWVQESSEALRHAVELATQQFDREKIPRDPIPARMEDARHIVNKILSDLGGPARQPR
jgi:hypothetical protein